MYSINWDVRIFEVYYVFMKRIYETCISNSFGTMKKSSVVREQRDTKITKQFVLEAYILK